MKPELILGPITLPAYITLMMVGFLVATFYVRRRADARGLDGRILVDVCVVALLAGVVGARGAAVLTDGKLGDFVNLCTDPARVEATMARARYCTHDAQCGDAYVCEPSWRQETEKGARKTMCHPRRDCFAAFKFWTGGLTFFGGVLLAGPLALWFARRRGLKLWQTADLLAPAVALGHAIGKLGCFLEGCCFGPRTAGFMGLQFPGHPEPRLPTQLFESAASLAIFLTLHRFSRGKQPGSVVGSLLVSMGVLRFVLDFMRDDERGSVGPLSFGQLLALGAIASGIAILIKARPQDS